LLEPAIMQHCTLTPTFPSQEDGNKRKHTHSITLRRATNTEPSQVGRWLSIYPTRCSRGLLALQCIQWVEQWNLFLWGRPGSGLGVLKLARSPSPALGPPLYYVCPIRWSDQTTRQGVVPEPTARVGPLPAPILSYGLRPSPYTIGCAAPGLLTHTHISLYIWIRVQGGSPLPPMGMGPPCKHHVRWVPPAPLWGWGGLLLGGDPPAPPVGWGGVGFAVGWWSKLNNYHYENFKVIANRWESRKPRNLTVN
jgi:hypothetical protein